MAKKNADRMGDTVGNGEGRRNKYHQNDYSQNGRNGQTRSDGFFSAFNWLFDTAFPNLPTLSSVKVLGVVFRQTWGWVDEQASHGRKWQDVISYSQFREKIGSTSNDTVRNGIETCVARGFLERKQIGTDQGCFNSPIFAYRCVLVCPTPWSTSAPVSGALSTPVSGALSTPVSGNTNQVLTNLKEIDNDHSPAGAGECDAVASRVKFPDFGEMISLLSNLGVAKSVAKRWALDYRDRPGHLLAWVHYCESRKSRIGNVAAYLTTVLSNADPAPVCVWCDRSWRKSRTCTGCGGPVCFDHVEGDDDGRVWCTVCYEYNQVAGGDPDAVSDDEPEPVTQDLTFDDIFDVVEPDDEPEPVTQDHGVGFGDNGTGNRAPASDWLNCSVCGQLENRTYMFACRDCSGRYCADCAQQSFKRGDRRRCPDCLTAGVEVVPAGVK